MKLTDFRSASAEGSCDFLQHRTTRCPPTLFTVDIAFPSFPTPCKSPTSPRARVNRISGGNQVETIVNSSIKMVVATSLQRGMATYLTRPLCEYLHPFKKYFSSERCDGCRRQHIYADLSTAVCCPCPFFFLSPPLPSSVAYRFHLFHHGYISPVDNEHGINPSVISRIRQIINAVCDDEAVIEPRESMTKLLSSSCFCM